MVWSRMQAITKLCVHAKKHNDWWLYWISLKSRLKLSNEFSLSSDGKFMGTVILTRFREIQKNYVNSGYNF